MTNQKTLIGGQALRILGSDRFTNDFNYLINDVDTKEAFITSEKVDYLNANGHNFFNDIYKIEKGNEIATPNSLLQLKAFAFVQHCQNFNWQKVDACEYDIKFLVRKFNVRSLDIVKKYVYAGELAEIQKVINSVK